MTMPVEKYYFNGIDGATGSYLTNPISRDELARYARANFSPQSGESRDWLFDLRKSRLSGFYALPRDANAADLSRCGWGVVFAQACDPAIIDALRPLTEHRAAAAGDLYRCMMGDQGYRPGETNVSFLRRFDAPTAGSVEPERMPYYLLLVGDPKAIPFSFQYQLDVNHAVGRLCFDQPEDYANYARSVVQAETGGVARGKSVRFFGVSNGDDPATNMSRSILVEPLANYAKLHGDGWSIETDLGENATKERLRESIAARGGPALLFTASHGMGYASTDTRQARLQGALLCQDWPGPRAWAKAIPERFFLSSDDIAADDDVHGLIAFHFACYGMGTPRLDDYAVLPGGIREKIADVPFVSALPKAMLAHPKGGALACVGHVERAWSCSFMSGEAAAIGAFKDAVFELLKGLPVGHAMASFHQKYADLSTQLTAIFEADRGKPQSTRYPDDRLVGQWIEHNDARSYVILGDPFVRLMPDRLNSAKQADRPQAAEIDSGMPGPIPPEPPKKTSGPSKTKTTTTDRKSVKAKKKPKPGTKEAAKPGSGSTGKSDDGKVGTLPGGFRDITNYLFIDPQTGGQLTVTASERPVDESRFFESAWSHVSTAVELLGAVDVRLSETKRTDDGRTLLTASYVVGEGDDRRRESIGLVRLPDGHCVQVQLVTAPDDPNAQTVLIDTLQGIGKAETKKPIAFSERSMASTGAKSRERVGEFSVPMPTGYEFQGVHQFVSDDGTTRIDIDFRAEAVAPRSFATQPDIGVRSQFKAIESVRRFLRNPIRYEVPDFEPVANEPGAVAFGARKSPVHTADESLDLTGDTPALRKIVEIDGHQAVVRLYAADPDAAADAENLAQAFLDHLN